MASKEYYQLHKDEIKARAKKYYQDNKEKCQERSRAYCKKHSAEHYERRKARRLANIDAERAQDRAWYLAHKKEHRDYGIEKRYGLKPGEFESRLASQGGACAICRTTDFTGRLKTPHVDHDHGTGKVRGILCGRCNVALGMADDSIEKLLSMIEYLRKHTP